MIVLFLLILCCCSSSLAAGFWAYLSGLLFGKPKYYKKVRELSEEMDPPQTEAGSEEWVNAWKAVCKDHPNPDFLQSYPEDTFGQMVVWVQGKLDPARMPRQRCKDLLAM